MTVSDRTIPGAVPWDERCIAWVPEPPHYLHKHRCTRRSGYGIQGRYCKQHAKHPDRTSA
jgi:hypothetical protein